MIDNTTDAFHSAIQVVLDMARPVVALAGSFALVLIVVGVGAFLLAQKTETPTTAVLQWNARSVVVYGPESGVENGCAWRLDATMSGTWMIGPCGLLEFTGMQWSLATEIPFPLGAMDVAVATDGTVWIGNVDTGVVSYNGESLIEHEVIAPWVEVTRDGMLWARRLSLGLVSFDGAAWVDKLDTGSVTDLAVDGNGTLWVVADAEPGDQITSGIKELRAGGWVLHEPPEDISMMDLIATPDGIALFSDNAVLRFDGTEWTMVAVPSLTDLGVVPTAGFEDEPLDVVDTLEVTDAAVSANGDVWIASSVYGALRYREGTWVRFTTEDGLASNHLTFVEAGSDGSVWFGSDDAGLTRLLTVPSNTTAPETTTSSIDTTTSAAETVLAVPVEGCTEEYTAFLRGRGGACDLVEGEGVTPVFGPLLDGGWFDLTELRGRPAVVLTWVASYGPGNRDALAEFQILYDKWSDQIGFVSISEDTAGAAQQTVEVGGFTFPVVTCISDPGVDGTKVLCGPNEEEFLWVWWGNQDLPSWIVLDSDGRFVDIRLGGQTTIDDIDSLLASAVASEPDS
jgi:hypothetical protein